MDVVFSPDGKTLAVTDATSPALVLIDPTTNKISRSVNLSGPPSGVVWTSDSKRLFVSESGTHRIAEIDTAKGTVTRRLNTGRYPRGLAIASRRSLLLATDWGLDQLAVIDLTTGTTKARIPVSCQPTAVAVTPDESLAFVSNLLPATAATAPGHASEISVIDLQTLQPKASIHLPLGSTNTRGIVISGDGRSAYVVHTLGRFNLPTTQLDRGWVITNALSIIDVPSCKLTATVLLDQVMDGAADPWGVALGPAGARLFVTLAGVHQLAVIDLERLPELFKTDPEALMSDLAALYRNNLIRRIDLPVQGPRGIATSSDGRSLAIAGYFSGDVVLTDIDVAKSVVLPLGPTEKPDLVRQGEFAFHNANTCFQRWLSCSSCHPDARADGLNWDLLNDGLGNPKNARSMVWAGRTPPMMTLGIRSSVEVAAKAGFVHIEFTEPKEQDLKSVVAYLKSLQPVTSPHRKEDGSLTDSAQRGEKLFQSQQVGCFHCHPAPLFSNLSSYDVGTANASDRDVTRFDTPTLVEGWRNPPYLHDGSAVTLRDVITKHNTEDRHGKTSQLAPEQIEDLVEYLNSL
jgi:YVTN family beta-propeller protein